MTKNLAYSLLMVFGSSVLGACQMFDAVKGHPDSKSDVNQNTVQIYCSGAESCQFGRLDDLIVVNEKTQRINSDAVKRGWVKYTESTELNKQLYLYVPAKQHELVIRFYPISQQHAEVFHVIHRFKANQKYTFKMTTRAFISISAWHLKSPTNCSQPCLGLQSKDWHTLPLQWVLPLHCKRWPKANFLE